MNYRQVIGFVGITVAVIALLVMPVFGLGGARAADTGPGLSPTELEQCEAEGGCAYVSRKWVFEQLKKAYDAGIESTREQCRNRL